ncbi:hypothetical protein BMS3Bbin02_02251 [bacterium BMS3Bbin02]|nr:hypothetical protein BMS3Bbin02_02251 [bacterium BMS3Bbin02]
MISPRNIGSPGTRMSHANERSKNIYPTTANISHLANLVRPTGWVVAVDLWVMAFVMTAPNSGTTTIAAT